MFKYLKITVIVTLVQATLYAAPSGIYIELGAGVGLNDTQKTKSAQYVYDRKYIGSLALGYQYETLRIEIEERYKKDSLYSTPVSGGSSLKVSGDLVSDSQMLNFYYSGYNQSKLVSTVGVGAGVTSLSLGEIIKDKAIPSLQAMFSIGYMLSDSFTMSGEYTYFYTDTSTNFKANGDNTFSLSLRYLF